MLYCPECKKKIYNVTVISECIQKASLTQHNKLKDWTPATVEDTLKILCPKCSADIRYLVDEC
jgi:hypothetical protein